MDNANSDYCSAQPPEEVLTPGLVSSAFRRTSLPPSRLIIQPPNGRTLVNFDTNFFTKSEAFTRSVTLLGQQVDLRIRPSGFDWQFGDGESTTTTTAGAPYPDLEITHAYLRVGDLTPRVDTTYTADFRVGNGAWQPVPGTVTINGSGVDLEVVEAQPTLVGYE